LALGCGAHGDDGDVLWRDDRRGVAAAVWGGLGKDETLMASPREQIPKIHISHSRFSGLHRAHIHIFDSDHIDPFSYHRSSREFSVMKIFFQIPHLKMTINSIFSLLLFNVAYASSYDQIDFRNISSVDMNLDYGTKRDIAKISLLKEIISDKDLPNSFTLLKKNTNEVPFSKSEKYWKDSIFNEHFHLNKNDNDIRIIMNWYKRQIPGNFLEKINNYAPDVKVMFLDECGTHLDNSDAGNSISEISSESDRIQSMHLDSAFIELAFEREGFSGIKVPVFKKRNSINSGEGPDPQILSFNKFLNLHSDRIGNVFILEKYCKDRQSASLEKILMKLISAPGIFIGNQIGITGSKNQKIYVVKFPDKTSNVRINTAFKYRLCKRMGFSVTNSNCGFTSIRQWVPIAFIGAKINNFYGTRGGSIVEGEYRVHDQNVLKIDDYKKVPETLKGFGLAVNLTTYEK